jgi:hypothetical protein
MMLSQLLAGVSEDTRTRMLYLLKEDIIAHRASVHADKPEEPMHADNMLLFLSDNMPVLLGCADSQRDDVLWGLLDAYELQTQAGACVLAALQHPLECKVCKGGLHAAFLTPLTGLTASAELLFVRGL